MRKERARWSLAAGLLLICAAPPARGAETWPAEGGVHAEAAAAEEVRSAGTPDGSGTVSRPTRSAWSGR